MYANPKNLENKNQLPQSQKSFQKSSDKQCNNCMEKLNWKSNVDKPETS